MPGISLTFANLRDLCQRRGLVFKTHEDTGQIALLYRILDEDAPLYIIPYPGRGMVSFVLPLPFRVPAARYPFIGEAATRLHHASCMGTWALDLETGELSFRITLPVHGAEYTEEGVLFVTRVVVSTVEAAAADLRQIALAGETASGLWPRRALVPGA
jgi:hypothetical protein